MNRHKNTRSKRYAGYRLFGVTVLILMLGGLGCTGPEVVKVPQNKVEMFLKDKDQETRFTLQRAVVLHVPQTGQEITLNRGTEWFRVAMTDAGDIYQTYDQLLVLRDSNSYEAWIVVKDGVFKGFLLRVQKTFVPSPVPVKLSI